MVVHRNIVQHDWPAFQCFTQDVFLFFSFSVSLKHSVNSISTTNNILAIFLTLIVLAKRSTILCFVRHLFFLKVPSMDCVCVYVFFIRSFKTYHHILIAGGVDFSCFSLALFCWRYCCYLMNWKNDDWFELCWMLVIHLRILHLILLHQILKWSSHSWSCSTFLVRLFAIFPIIFTVITWFGWVFFFYIIRYTRNINAYTFQNVDNSSHLCEKELRENINCIQWLQSNMYTCSCVCSMYCSHTHTHTHRWGREREKPRYRDTIVHSVVKWTGRITVLI